MLGTTKQVMTWLCMLPHGKTLSQMKRIAYVMVGLAVFLTNLSGTASHLAFLWKYLSINLEACFFPIMVASTEGSMAYISIAAFLMRHKTEKVFQKLLSICNLSEC